MSELLLLLLLVEKNLYFPDCLKVGVNEKGNQVFKLDVLTELNNIFHNAHDAMGDVDATIEIAKILKKSSNKVWNAGLKNNNKLETKSERSLIIGLILIDIFLRGGESIGLIGSNINVKKGRENFTTLANEFVNKNFKLVDSRIKKGDFLFILSDFLEKPKSLFNPNLILSPSKI